MSTAILDELVSVARRTSISACWNQWVVVGSGASPAIERRARSIVDPEALVLLSLYHRRNERRLADLVGWWAKTGSRLTSVKRLRTIARRFPGPIESHFGVFAQLAADEGDRRWRRHAGGSAPISSRSGKGPSVLSMAEPSSLMLRMRAGFGVGAKADVLTYLLGVQGARATVSTLSQATGYTGTALRTACGDLSLSRLIKGSPGRPKSFFLTPKPWAEVLEIDIPPWQFWADLFVFLAAIEDWASRAGENDISVHVAASQARDLVEEHGDAFAVNGIAVPSPSDYPGPSFLQGALDTLRVVERWVEEHL